MQNTPNLSNIRFTSDLNGLRGYWLLEEGFSKNLKKKVREFKHTDGHIYIIEAKYTQEYSRMERVGRVLLGIALTILPLIGSNWSPKDIQNLFLKKRKNFKLAVLKKDNASATATATAVNTAASAAIPQPAPSLPQPTPAPAHTNQVSAKENQDMTESYFKVADRGILLHAFLDQLAVAVNSRESAWNSSLSLALLSNELQGINNEIKSCENDAQTLVQRACSHPKLEDDIQKIKELEKSAVALKAKHADLFKALQRKINSQPQQNNVIGLANDGNTCYINSALQPLLALGNFPDLIPEMITQRPDESDRDFLGRSLILASLHEFIKAWKEKKPPDVLGSLVGALRRDIFQAGLAQGMLRNMEEIGRFQEAGQFFELILHVIDREFLLKESRSVYLSDDFQARATFDTNPANIYILRSTASVQQAVNNCRDPQRLGTDFQVVDPRTQQQVTPAYQLESYKILGQPPELLVVQMWPNRIVNPAEDGIVDFSPLFEMQIPQGQANYELVGFSQNHHQVHWTAVVRNGEGWNYCNDASVESVDPESSEFTFPANFLVYKKKS